MTSLHALWGDSAVKKFNVFELFMFGKHIGAIARIPQEDTKLGKINWRLYQAKDALVSQLMLDSIILPASRRAASDLVEAIDACSEQAKTGGLIGLLTDNDTEVPGWKITHIKEAAEKLEAVLAADMPGISSYVVAQKGIYKTEDLIESAKKHITVGVDILPAQATKDIDAAGRCLAFELSTASAFHMWRAVETVMQVYLTILTGKTIEDTLKKNRNWGACIKALEVAGAPTKITLFLQHIKDEYRNPTSHPEENIELNEAKSLFSVAISSIEQIISAIRKLAESSSSSEAE